VVAQNIGDLRQAEILYRDAISRQQHAYGSRHPETAKALGNYGLLLQREGRLEEAEPLLRNALAITLDLYGHLFPDANRGVLDALDKLTAPSTPHQKNTVKNAP